MRTWWYFAIVPVGLIVCLFFVRLVLSSQLDDVTPEISCDEKLLDLTDIYYVIPKFNNISISENKEWCKGILAREKELAMHGVYHVYNEFGDFRDGIYFQDGVDIFEECFGVVPKRFKPGQLKWNKENDWIKKEMNVDLFWNQLFHKVYHCEDTGKFPNWFIRIF